MVEAVVMQLPGVTDSAALSVVDGEGHPALLVAYCAPAPVDPARFGQALREFQRVKIVRLAAIPRNPMGKIERGWLREKAQSGELERLPVT
jgi:acyl-CoA synthetase (AMP-forming)/AMP-acid ligase II